MGGAALWGAVSHAPHRRPAAAAVAALVTPLARVLAERIRAEGPIPFRDFMEAALYDPEHGYYATRARRIGRGGDFYTSVSLGPFLGRALARLAARADLGLGRPSAFDVTEFGAGSGDLARDVLRVLHAEDPIVAARTRMLLLERGAGPDPEIAAALLRALGEARFRVHRRLDTLPRLTGFLYANELLDAFPAHRVRFTENGLEEAHVGLGREGLEESWLAPSTPALDDHFRWLSLRGEPGTEAEAPLDALAWLSDVAARMDRGMLVLLDYGHEAKVLFGGGRPKGTLRAFREHRVSGDLLADPGAQDLTYDPDLTAVKRRGVEVGLELVAHVSQARLLLSLGILEGYAGRSLGERLAIKELILPGGMGERYHAVVFAKGMKDARAVLPPIPDG